jgi:hypothetical protein
VNEKTPTPLENQQLAQSKSELGTFWHRARSAVVSDFIEKNSLKSVADIGAGAGHLGNWIRVRDTGLSYFFEEELKSVEDILVQKFGESNRLRSTDPLEVDLVVLLDVLEHIENDSEFLKIVRGRMRVNSKILVTVPAGKFLFSWWDSELGHFRRYNKKTLNSLFVSAGFSKISVAYLFPELVFPSWLRKLRGPKLDNERSAEFPVLPKTIDMLLFRLVRFTSLFRKLTPIGTSLILIGEY